LGLILYFNFFLLGTDPIYPRYNIFRWWAEEKSLKKYLNFIKKIKIRTITV
jgi:hypothetical protein